MPSPKLSWLKRSLKKDDLKKNKETNKLKDKGATHIGDWAETQALNYLLDRSYKLKNKNYHCQYGEIDIIMTDPQRSLIFVEVRYRKQSSHGSPLETVDIKKQRKLIKAAQHYLQRHRLSEQVNCRFDVISVEPSSNLLDNQSNQNTKIDWVKNAFTA